LFPVKLGPSGGLIPLAIILQYDEKNHKLRINSEPERVAIHNGMLEDLS